MDALLLRSYRDNESDNFQDVEVHFDVLKHGLKIGWIKFELIEWERQGFLYQYLRDRCPIMKPRYNRILALRDTLEGNHFALHGSLIDRWYH